MVLVSRIGTGPCISILTDSVKNIPALSVELSVKMFRALGIKMSQQVAKRRSVSTYRPRARGIITRRRTERRSDEDSGGDSGPCHEVLANRPTIQNCNFYFSSLQEKNLNGVVKR